MFLNQSLRLWFTSVLETIGKNFKAIMFYSNKLLKTVSFLGLQNPKSTELHPFHIVDASP
jgi:hypothetical protein